MWICSRCHTENHENLSVCESCGTARSAGRFSAPAMRNTARAPHVSPAPAPETRRMPPVYQPPPTDMPPARPPKSFLQSFARLVGILLCVLLPLAGIAGWFFVNQMIASLPAWMSLWADVAPGWKIIAQIFLGLLSLLLSLLPGLWTLLLCAPRPPKYRRVKK